MFIEYFPEKNYECPFKCGITKEQVVDYIKNNNNYATREINRCWVSFSMPTQDLLADLKFFIGDGVCLEICAGRGVWSLLLGDTVKIIPTDLFVKDFTFVQIEQLDAVHAVQKYSEADCLLVVWPLCDDVVAHAIQKFGGNKLIYVGQNKNGCTGSKKMFDILEAEWDAYKYTKLHSEFTTDDGAHFFYRKLNTKGNK